MILDHIAIAVKDFDETIEFFERLTGSSPRIETDEERGLKIAIFPLKNVKIEIITPIRENTPISKFLNKRGNAVHHLAFKVSNLDEYLKKFPPLTPVEKGITASRIVFLDLNATHRILIELLED